LDGEKRRMTKSIKEGIEITTTLLLVCIVSALVLSFAYAHTIDKINENKLAELNAKLKIVLPQAAKFQEIENNLDAILVKQIIAAKDNEGLDIGKAIVFATNGYQGEIRILAGINTEKKIQGMIILQHMETPGLGARITEKTYIDNYKDQAAENIKDIDTITGATVSSAALKNAVENMLQQLE